MSLLYSAEKHIALISLFFYRIFETEENNQLANQKILLSSYKTSIKIKNYNKNLMVEKEESVDLTVGEKCLKKMILF